VTQARQIGWEIQVTNQKVAAARDAPQSKQDIGEQPVDEFEQGILPRNVSLDQPTLRSPTSHIGRRASRSWQTPWNRWCAVRIQAA